MALQSAAIKRASLLSVLNKYERTHDLTRPSLSIYRSTIWPMITIIDNRFETRNPFRYIMKRINNI